MPSNQRRLLLLKQLLDEETDCEHKISVQEIIDRLKLSLPTMKMDARTIRADLDALDQASFSIYSEKGKFGKLLYSRGDRVFSHTEIRLLMDTVFAAHFLPRTVKAELIEGLKMLVSKPLAEDLPDVLLETYGPSWLFDKIQNQIDLLQRAMRSDQCMKFSYCSPDGEAERTVSHFAPYVLTWQGDFCYIVGKCEETKTIHHYRVDRIRNIQITEATFNKETFDFQLYAEHHFLRFSANGEAVKLRFAVSVSSRLIDLFGPALNMERDDEGYLIVQVRTLRLKALQEWILQWGSEVEVLEPASLRDSIKKEIACMQAIYNERTEA